MKPDPLGKTFRIAIIGMALVVSLAQGFYLLGFRLNDTPSVPRGLWRISRLEGPLQRGQIVNICPRDSAVFRLAKARGYIHAGRVCPDDFTPLLKPVAALAGDRVTINAQGIRVNGRLIPRSRQEEKDSQGRSLPRMPWGAYQVASGFVWVVSNHIPNSFDSRYFGSLPVRNIQGLAEPVWISL